MSFYDQLRSLLGMPGVDQQKLMQELFRQQAIERAQANQQKTATEVQALLQQKQQMGQQQLKALEQIQAAQAKAIQAGLADQQKLLAAQTNAKFPFFDGIGGLGNAYQPPPHQAPPQAPAFPQKGPSYTSLLFSEWDVDEADKTFVVPKPVAKTIESLNNVDEVEMEKKKSPLAKEVAKLTKPVQKIIEPVLDPDPTLEHMLVRQAREKMLAERKEWSTAQQRQPSVLNTTLTRLDAWNVVWSALGELSGDAKLEQWLVKRVHQVCDNVIDPSLSALAVDSILNPKPHLVKKAPPPEPINPFDREFS